MRLVEDIPHHTFKIGLHSYNSKYIVKIEWGQYEQTFKIPEGDVMGANHVKELLTEELLENCMRRFKLMHADWYKAFNGKDYSN
jgi:hypothetical protein